MFKSLDRQPKITTLEDFLIYDFAFIIHIEFFSALWNYVRNLVSSNYAWQVGWSLRGEQEIAWKPLTQNCINILVLASALRMGVLIEVNKFT